MINVIGKFNKKGVYNMAKHHLSHSDEVKGGEHSHSHHKKMHDHHMKMAKHHAHHAIKAAKSHHDHKAHHKAK